MTFIYVSGAGTDSTEHGRVMWARVKGRTENALLRLPLNAYMFRPGVIQPLDGIRSKTASYRILYALTKPLLPLLRWAMPNQILTTREIGQAMLNVARRGYPKRILEVRDIRAASKSVTPISRSAVVRVSRPALRQPRRRGKVRFHGGTQMAAGAQLAGNGETIDLQQQVARLQALLEASRQVHSTTDEQEVLEQVLRIVVRELEMAGAAFPDTGLSYGEIPPDAAEGSAMLRLSRSTTATASA